MDAVTHHPRRALALATAIAIALLALLPGSWAGVQAQTAGTPPPSCPTGLTLQADGTCGTPPVTIVNPAAGTRTTVVTGAGATVETGQGGGSVAVTVPAGAMPAGSTVTVTEPSTIQRISTGYNPVLGVAGSTISTTYTAVMSLTATDSSGNPITGDFAEPVTVRITPPLASFSGTTTAVKVRNVNNAFTPPRVTEVTCTPVAGSSAYDCALPHFSDWDLLVEFTAPEGADLDDVLAGLLPAESPPTAGAPTAPSPANTGMGGDDSGANNTVAIVLGAVALAGVLAAGGRYAVRRRA